MNKYIIFTLLTALQSVFTKSHSYCVHHQTGSDSPKVRVTVYNSNYAASNKIDVLGHRYGTGKDIATIWVSGPVRLGQLTVANQFKARHVIARGDKKCWNWESIQSQLHNKKLNSLWFVFEAMNTKTRIGAFSKELNIRDGINYCVKNGIAEVTVGMLDPRCGSQP